MPEPPTAPRDVFLTANRLRHHLLEWGSSGPEVLLVHGLMEHAHAWDFVAARLAGAGFHVFALDWRGHGDSEWIGPGGYYHFADYAADLAAIVRQIGGTVALVGHSMGGNAAIQFAGAVPDRVTRLAVIEGLGPPDSDPGVAPDRYAQWIADLERTERRGSRALTLEDAAAKLAERFTLFSPEVARHMAQHGTRPIANANGGPASREHRTWKFDPLHQTRAPQPFYVAQARAFWQRITCPVLYIDGTRSFLSAAAEDLARRVAEIGARHVTLAGAGHHPHLEQPEQTARVLLDFLADADETRAGGL